MTENSVQISITINVAEEEMRYQKEIPIEELEEVIETLTREIGQKVLKASFKVIDDQTAKKVPRGWRNVGSETRQIISSLGAVSYKRRIYLDGENRRRKPVDEVIGIERYGRASSRVQVMGSYLACTGTYRMAAEQLGWLLKTPVCHSTIQRMVWTVGNRITDGEEAERSRIFEAGAEVEAGQIEAPVLYGESDGVWVHLQREAQKTIEVRVAILSSGKKLIGKDRYRLENKCSMTSIGLNSEAWQEQILRTAHQVYNLANTKLLITGGDGNQWVRHSFDRLDIRQEFVLDYFHLKRAAKRALHDKNQADELVKLIRSQGFEAVEEELITKIGKAEGKQAQKLKEFYRYLHNNRDVLLDLEHRGVFHPTCLGAMEGNVDKLVVHRMKGRGCSWRLPGLRAMLALCRHRDQLGKYAYHFLPLEIPAKSRHQNMSLREDDSEVINKPMPVFSGPSRNKPWVISLFRYTHGR